MKTSTGLFIRGRYIEDNLVEFGGRGGEIAFQVPDPGLYADQLGLASPTALADLYDLSFDDLLDYLVELGPRLDVNKNEYVDQARLLSYKTAAMTPPLIDASFAALPRLFERDTLRQMVEKPLGTIAYLEGWVPHTMVGGEKIEIRAFGARAVHIIAGNHPVIALLTVIRNALTRSDAIIKVPSNDPFFAIAIARTMNEMAPKHPITKHLAVAYWKGGDIEVEKKIYNPATVEKIVAWGGFASIKHITRYMQPGLELVTLDPKSSASIVGKAAFENEEAMRDAARRIATDIGTVNQAGCVNARVIYVLSGTDAEGLNNLNRLGQYVYDAMLKLPGHLSTKPRGGINSELKDYLDSARLNDEWYRVIGGNDDEGAIVVSQLSEPVEFASYLNDRVGNLVPVDSVDEALKFFDAYSQTVGIYPDSLKEAIKDRAPLYGAQRLVSLGYACNGGMHFAAPQDAMEPVRRMVKWIVNEVADPAVTPPLWEGNVGFMCNLA